MLPSYKHQWHEEVKKKYRKIGYDACLHGVDRGIADDFAVEYRPYIRQGWDEANTDSLFKQVARLNLNKKS